MPAAKTNAKPDPAKEAEKQAKFKEIATLRAKKAASAIRTLQKVANKRQYAYNDMQVSAIVTLLRGEVDKVEAAFKAGKGSTEVELSL